MKFSCERCQTRYSIGDEKVRGKVLKIRCKTCGNIVVVRESTGTGQAQAEQAIAAASSTGGGVTSLAPPQSASAAGAPRAPAGRPDVDWYVAIKGKQHGPAKRDEVARLFREGKISDRSYLWHEGMAAWTRLREVPQFASLLQPTGAEAPPSRRPPPPPSDEHGEARQGAEIIPFDEARRARDADPFAAVTARQGVGPVTSDPFAADPFAAVSGVHGGGDGAPRDSTRVFIMQAGLHNRGQKHRLYAGITAGFLLVLSLALFSDYQGLIEIPGLHRVVNAVAQREDKPKIAEAMGNWDDAEEDPKLKCKLMPNPEQCVKQTLVLNDIRRARRKAKAAAAVQEGLMDGDNFNTTGPVASGGDASLRGGGTGVGGTADISDAASAAQIAAVFKKDEKKITVPKPKIEPIAISGSDIDAESVYKTISQNNESVRNCVEQGAKIGDVPVGRQILILGIEPNGRVSKATFRDGPTNASAVGECIRDTAKRWKFQAFPGPAADVEVPLILSVGM